MSQNPYSHIQESAIRLVLRGCGINVSASMLLVAHEASLYCFDSALVEALKAAQDSQSNDKWARERVGQAERCVAQLALSFSELNEVHQIVEAVFVSNREDIPGFTR